MVSDTELIVYGVGGFLLLNMLSKGELGSGITKSAADTVASVPRNLAQSGVENILIKPYEWAVNYKGYIPIIDDLAKGFATVKSWGDPNRWIG